MKSYPRKVGWFSRLYATSDGRAFTDQIMAIEHQRSVDTNRFIQSVKEQTYQFQFDDEHDYTKFINFLDRKDVKNSINFTIWRMFR